MGLVLPPQISVGAARAAISALRDGVPPSTDVAEWLTVGQDSLSHSLHGAIDRTAAAGTSEARLLLGVPGAGKSHVLARLRGVSLSRGFLISHCVQDRTTRTTLNRPDLVYQELMTHLQVDESTKNVEALRLVLDGWASKALKVVGGTAPRLGRLYELVKAGLLPDPISKVPRRTGLALIGYLLSVERQDNEAREVMINAFRGVKLENRRLIEVATRNGLQHAWGVGWTPSDYDASYWLGQLATLAHMARVSGKAGTVLLLDELESLIDLPRSNSRRKAYEGLHALLFNDYGAPALLTVLAFTPAFVTGLRKDADGLGAMYHKEWAGFWQHQTEEIPTLRKAEAIELIQRIAALHGTAYRWSPVPENNPAVGAVVSAWSRMGGSVGDLVRSGVSALDTMTSD